MELWEDFDTVIFKDLTQNQKVSIGLKITGSYYDLTRMESLLAEINQTTLHEPQLASAVLPRGSDSWLTWRRKIAF